MVHCLCGKILKTEGEFETHIDKCPLIGSELWDAITDGWEQIKTHQTLQDFVIEEKPKNGGAK